MLDILHWELYGKLSTPGYFLEFVYNAKRRAHGRSESLYLNLV